MILEGIMTTRGADGEVNISPMGPIVDEQMQTLVLRPYQTSTTFANLRRSGVGIFHVTDDVEMIARAAVGRLEPGPELVRCAAVDGFVLAGACRWYAVRVKSIDDRQPRTEIVAEVVDSGRLRDFFGFSRAKHAVIEAAILATRIEFLPPEQILADYEKLNVLVEKTGGDAERAAFDFLWRYVRHSAGREDNTATPAKRSAPQ